jgi:Domain of unknown function (DUF4340)
MNRKTLTAGVVFAVLAAVAFLVLRSPEKGSRTGEAPRPIARIGPGDLDTIEVTKAGGTTVIKRNGSSYQVLKPHPYAADQDAAKQAFEALEKLEFDGIISDQKSKQDEMEVGAAAVRVVARKGDKLLADLRIGKTANNVTLVRLEGKDQIWQAVGYLKYQFDKYQAGWRDKSITTFDEKDAQRIEVASKVGGKIVLARPPAKDGGAGGEWTVAESSVKVDPLDKSVAPGIISALYSWKANDFADSAKPEETGLASPENTITIGLKGDKKVTVLIGKKKGEEDYYVRTADKPQVFLVKKYNLERINKRPIEFREKTVCNLNEGEIVEVQVARDKDAYTLVKQPGKTGDEAWKVTKPPGVTLDTSKVNTIIAAFKDWKATSFAEDGSPKLTGLAKPTATITARSNINGSGCTLKVGSELSDKQNTYLARTGGSDVFVVPKWSIDRILVKVDDLKKKS